MARSEFHCTKLLLILLNIFYMILSVILMSVSAYAKTFNIISSNNIIGAVLFCAVILFLLSFIGLIATAKHHQVLLFFYMFFLTILFMIQFIISIVCIAVSYYKNQNELLLAGWNRVDVEIKHKFENEFKCCAFSSTRIGDLDCSVNDNMDKLSCFTFIVTNLDKYLRIIGFISMFFSFTQFLGVWTTFKYRNQRDTKFSPRSFL